MIVIPIIQPRIPEASVIIQTRRPAQFMGQPSPTPAPFRDPGELARVPTYRIADFFATKLLAIVIALFTMPSQSGLIAGPLKGKQFNTKSGNSIISNSRNEAPENWKKLLNPRTIEFWEENNGYLPDKGWLIYLQNPTDENARYWLLRGEIKALEMNKIQSHLAKVEMQLIQEGVLEDRYNRLKSMKADAALKKIANTKGLAYYFLFSPNCSACSKQAGVLKNFKNVHPLQVSGKRLKHYPGIKRSKWADKKVKDDYLEKGVTPVTIIHNQENKTILLAEGYTDFKKLMLMSGRIQIGKK